MRQTIFKELLGENSEYAMSTRAKDNSLEYGKQPEKGAYHDTKERRFINAYWDGQNVGILERDYLSLSASQVEDVDHYLSGLLPAELCSIRVEHVTTDWGLTDIIVIPSHFIEDERVQWLLGH